MTKAIHDLRNRFSGCLLGGAVGDALGAPVEFMSLSEIRTRFGPNGIQDYAPAYGRRGTITDDTQMTLFTAEGMIRACNRAFDRGICSVETVVYYAYLRWLITQGMEPAEMPFPGEPTGWLYSVEGLHSRRAPGNTCLSALTSGKMGSPEQPLNNSKGCGGVMRVAPVGLTIEEDPFDVGCNVAAITHGHPSGYLAAGVLARIIHDIVRGSDLPNAIEAACDKLTTWKNHEECLDAIQRAVDLADHGSPTPETVESLGAGWVAEAALAISLYCALSADNFASGVLLAVNHSGDSDSTGAITGNILGALLGREAIPEHWVDDLELREVIEELSLDMVDYIFGDLEYDKRDFEKYPTY